MKTLFMTVGVPCSGKSSYKTKMWFSGMTASTDEYIEMKAQVLGKTYGDVWEEFIGEANTFMQETIKNAIERGKDIYWDQTNLTPKVRTEKLHKFLGCGYHKVALVFLADEETLASRALKRARETGKVIPENVVKSMLKSLTVPTLAEGFDEIRIFENGKLKTIINDEGQFYVRP